MKTEQEIFDIWNKGFKEISNKLLEEVEKQHKIFVKELNKEIEDFVSNVRNFEIDYDKEELEFKDKIDKLSEEEIE